MGLFNPHTIGEREARSTNGSSVRNDEAIELRDKVVEMIGGFGLEEVEKLLLRETLVGKSIELV